MLRLFEGAITLESIQKLSYKDACKFHSDAVKIAEHHQQEMKKIQQNVKKLPN
jgi:hypothetical protein